MDNKDNTVYKHRSAYNIGFDHRFERCIRLRINDHTGNIKRERIKRCLLLPAGER